MAFFPAVFVPIQQLLLNTVIASQQNTQHILRQQREARRREQEARKQREAQEVEE